MSATVSGLGGFRIFHWHTAAAQPQQAAGEDVADLAEVRWQVGIRMWQGHRGSAWISCHVIT
ncbi:MAG: hypothetical protein ACK53N_18800 [Alphaproteobacteria bacterium]